MNKTKNSDNKKTDFTTVTKYLKQYKHYLVYGFLMIIVSNILLLYTPYISKWIFDNLENNADLTKIGNLVLLMIGLTLVGGVFRFGMRRTIIWMSRHVEYDLRGEIMKHLLTLPQSFYHKTRTGDIMARITNDLEAVRQMIGPGVMYITDAIIKLIIAFSIMIYLSPKLTLYVVVPLIILPIAVNLVANVLHKRSMKIQEHFSKLTTTAQENISGIRIIKAYRQENEEILNFEKQSSKYISLNMSLAKIHGVFLPLMRMTASLSFLSVFYFGSMAVINNEASLGTVVAFFGYLSIILWPVIALGWVLTLYQRGSASLKRINAILQYEPEIKDTSNSPVKKKMTGKIEFKNLTFSYNSEKILNGINLKIEPGQTVGLIGLTGSGKSTLVSLLPRLFPVGRGQLFIDDIDINDWELNRLRQQIGFAPQEPFLFSDTIKSNILFGTDIQSDEIMNKASETSALSKDIETFTDKFETMVGERGITLSGGQKQRTAIARAIVVDPAILILDDATSAVDTETEHEINDRIKDVLKGRTSIIISHRVSAVKDVDVIVYLEDGQIVEQGDHNQLMDENGNYAELYRSQLLEMELESL